MTDQFGEGMAHDRLILTDCYVYDVTRRPSPEPIPHGPFWRDTRIHDVADAQEMAFVEAGDREAAAFFAEIGA